MDTCHCLEPAILEIDASTLVCFGCHLPYDEALWQSDERRHDAIRRNREFTKEQQSIVDSIMAQAEKEQ